MEQKEHRKSHQGFMLFLIACVTLLAGMLLVILQIRQQTPPTLEQPETTEQTATVSETMPDQAIMLASETEVQTQVHTTSAADTETVYTSAISIVSTASTNPAVTTITAVPQEPIAQEDHWEDAAEELLLPPVIIEEIQELPQSEETVTVTTFSAEAFLEQMTLEEKIYQLFIVTPETLLDDAVSAVTTSGQMTQNALQRRPVGGLIYFARNLENGSQTRSMIANAQTFAKESGTAGLWIAVDEEGGSIARVADQLGTTAYSPMAVYGAKGDTDAVRAIGADIADDIAQYGFNLDFAPVADVSVHPGNELGSRIFSSDPQVVSAMAAAMVSGLQSSGQVSATLKHFPGLGAEDGNTHYDTAAYISRTHEQLEQTEFPAFRGGIDAGVDFVMIGHQIMSCVGDNLPSDLSETVVTDWLRGELGFTGIVITDAQNMQTICGTYSAGTAARMAIQAGADIVLMPTDLEAAYNSIYNAVQEGNISESRIDESVRRILTVKEKHGLLTDISINE